MRRLPVFLLFVLALAVAAPSGGPQHPESSRPSAVAAPVVVHHRTRHPRRRPDPFGARAVRLARHMLGVSYRYGGSSPGSGFDCSGFTSYVYGRLGVELPHNAAAQFGTGRPVPRSRLRPGDLLFFSGLGHVGMYVGRGRMIHAPQTGDVVRVVRLGVDYGGTLVGARRIAPPRPPHSARRLPHKHAV
jgi:cell wall-associated NlpC family hydrolase